MSGAAVCVRCDAAALGSSRPSGCWEILTVGFIALPVTIGIGILRYRLYDIDRIISRTLAYALVTGLLVGAYAALVLATAGARVPLAVAVAAATLAAAAVFNPVRRRVQRVVDRRFNRARYDADAAVEAFAARTAGRGGPGRTAGRPARRDRPCPGTRAPGAMAEQGRAVSAVVSPRRWLAICAAVLLAATVALVPLTILSHLQFDAVVALVVGVPSGVVGLLVARRQPGNPLGLAAARRSRSA